MEASRKAAVNDGPAMDAALTKGMGRVLAELDATRRLSDCAPRSDGGGGDGVYAAG